MVGTYLSAVRPRGCAQEHAPGGGADCALRERRFPPASPALPHRRPRPSAEAAEPRSAGCAPPRPTEPPSGPRTDPETAGRGAASGQTGAPAAHDRRGDARQSRGLDRRLGSLGILDLRSSHATAPAPHPASVLSRAREFPQSAPSGSSNPCRPGPSTKPRTGAQWSDG